jgi:hypothetical protein
VNKNSKIYKEFDALINGHSKLCFMGTYVLDEVRDIRIPLIRIKKHKFNKMFIEYMVLQDLIQSTIVPPQSSAKTTNSRKRSIKKEETTSAPLLIIDECPDRPETVKPSPIKE